VLQVDLKTRENNFFRVISSTEMHILDPSDNEDDEEVSSDEG